jgi:hypothetical protein
VSRVPGATQFLNDAVLASRGRSVAPDNIGNRIGSDLLSAGKNLAVPGLGVSANARQLNAQQVENSKGLYNNLFSAGASGAGSIDGLQKEVLALRASLPDDAIAPSARGIAVDEEV